MTVSLPGHQRQGAALTASRSGCNSRLRAAAVHPRESRAVPVAQITLAAPVRQLGPHATGRAVEQEHHELRLAPAGTSSPAMVDLVAAPRPPCCVTARTRRSATRPTSVAVLLLEKVGSFNLGVAGGGTRRQPRVQEKAAHSSSAASHRRPRTRSEGLQRRRPRHRLQRAALLGGPAVQPTCTTSAKCETIACVVGDKKHPPATAFAAAH